MSNQTLALLILLFPAASGASNLQKNYRRPLLILGCLVALVLLVACANVGNLLAAQAVAHYLRTNRRADQSQADGRPDRSAVRRRRRIAAILCTGHHR